MDIWILFAEWSQTYQRWDFPWKMKWCFPFNQTKFRETERGFSFRNVNYHFKMDAFNSTECQCVFYFFSFSLFDHQLFIRRNISMVNVSRFAHSNIIKTIWFQCENVIFFSLFHSLSLYLASFHRSNICCSFWSERKCKCFVFHV